ncbi:MAG: nuclear transport factor 2 family protein [Acidobacteria bacterium]|nr:nuclear transport factor 2 family protein [Acidobacteriota bacterium]
MKKLGLSIAISVFAVLSLNAQSSPDAAELTRLLNEFLAGAGRNDAAVHERFWANDLIYTRSTGVRINKNELMRGVLETPAAKPGDPVTVYSAEEIQIQQYGNAAVVAFKLIGTTTRSDGTKTVTRNLNTGTFIKRDGRWQAVAWQSTVIPDSPASTKAATTNSSSDGRKYILGPRGGCHYITESGRKVYVDKSNCN